MNQTTLKMKLPQGTEISCGNTVPVKVDRLISIYKGTKKLNVAKTFPNLDLNRQFMVRASERVLVATGIIVDRTEGYYIQVTSDPILLLKRGLLIIGPVIFMDIAGHQDKELALIVYNSTPYLGSLDYGERIAGLTFFSDRKDLRIVRIEN
jgi:dUTPase